MVRAKRGRTRYQRVEPVPGFAALSLLVVSAKRELSRAFTKWKGSGLHKTGLSAGARTGRARAAAGDGSTSFDSMLEEARSDSRERLLVRPAFILSSVRSGSTLLRVMLNTHSKIHAPHELHLRMVKVQLVNDYVTRAMAELGADESELQYLLWDRILHRELMRHGKSVLVNKTPNDVLIWRRIVECWPDARFIFLLRHPAATTSSWHRARKEWSRDRTAQDVLRYMRAVEEARTEHGGLTVRYEDVTEKPKREMRRICEFLGVNWEPKMVAYGAADHGDFKSGLGDWSKRIKTGKVLPARDLEPDENTPESLHAICTAWGYPIT
jgi:hypothetical protein